MGAITTPAAHGRGPADRRTACATRRRTRADVSHMSSSHAPPLSHVRRDRMFKRYTLLPRSYFAFAARAIRRASGANRVVVLSCPMQHRDRHRNDWEARRRTGTDPPPKDRARPTTHDCTPSAATATKHHRGPSRPAAAPAA